MVSREDVRMCIDAVADYLDYLARTSPLRLEALYMYIVEDASPSVIEKSIGVHRSQVHAMVTRIYEKCSVFGVGKLSALRVAKTLLMIRFGVKA